MRVIRGAAAARATLLKRTPNDEPELPPSLREAIRRIFGAELTAEAVVDRILGDVRKSGDAAIQAYDEAIDGIATDKPLEVSREEIEAAYAKVDQALVEALRFAADRIAKYHRSQLRHAAQSFDEGGLGQIVRPIEKVGMYVPGNKVIYPSTVLMTAIPARVAGVSQLVMVTPSSPDGSVAPLKLVAADIAKVDRVFRAGGVGGIAGLAYGTETIPRVDKICGPGNIFVTLAKKQLYGEIGIDGIFGPSETIVVADQYAQIRLVAADLLAGAEHDELATCILITDSIVLAEEIGPIMERHFDSIERADAARTSFETRGGAIVVGSIVEGVQLASEFAPEHLCLHVRDAEKYIDLVQNAGCVFVGENSVESIGDYTAGPSHVMPTGGSARFTSALGVHDFLKVTSLVRLDRETVKTVGPAGVAIGYAEGLTGHARSIESRLSETE
jgi:histidinol dehydrogenase